MVEVNAVRPRVSLKVLAPLAGSPPMAADRGVLCGRPLARNGARRPERGAERGDRNRALAPRFRGVKGRPRLLVAKRRCRRESSKRSEKGQTIVAIGKRGENKKGHKGMKRFLGVALATRARRDEHMCESRG
eukprot:749838-Prorocentrum_minimum.AAC.2